MFYAVGLFDFIFFFCEIILFLVGQALLTILNHCTSGKPELTVEAMKLDDRERNDSTVLDPRPRNEVNQRRLAEE